MEEYGWAITPVDSDRILINTVVDSDRILINTVRATRKECIKDEVESWSGMTWNELKRDFGLRCTKVTVKEGWSNSEDNGKDNS